jgi:hypothetical protein
VNKENPSLSTVDFKVVEIWYSLSSHTYSVEKTDEGISRLEYAIKIGNDFFPLGSPGDGLWMSDYVSDF